MMDIQVTLQLVVTVATPVRLAIFIRKIFTPTHSLLSDSRWILALHTLQ